MHIFYFLISGKQTNKQRLGCYLSHASVNKSFEVMGETNAIFVLGDTLPTHYDVAISLFSVATKPGSAKMKDTINKYTNTLIEIWEKSFGSKHVMRRKAVVGRLEKLALNYYNKVYNIANRTSVKHKGDKAESTLIRRLNKQWKTTSIEYRLQGVFQINSLFDVVVDEKSLEGAEKVFYQDQRTARICRVSEEIDEDWVKEQLAILEQKQQQQQTTDRGTRCTRGDGS